MKKTKIQYNTKKGFTLIETLVAIFILLISTTGPLTFAQSGLRASFVARDQIVAFYLAQDVIETIKSMRDNSSLAGEDWLNGIDSECLNSASGKGCQMDTGPTIDFKICSNTCDPMEFDSDTKQFVIKGDTSTKYTRTVHIKEIQEDKEVQIIVEVSWDTNFFADRRIVVQENIYNWVPEFTS